MKMKRQIIDNFLPYDQFKLAQSLIMDMDFRGCGMILLPIK